MESSLADRFAGLDHSLISSFRFTELTETAAAASQAENRR
jgi:hypothetical protein